MAVTEFNDLIALGTLKATYNSMTKPPQDKELRAKWMKAKSMVFEVYSAHWDACEKFVTKDDT